MSKLWKIIAGILVAIYPFAIFFGLNYFEPRYLAIVLLVVLIIRALTSEQLDDSSKLIKNTLLFLTSILIIGIVIYNSIDALKLYPVLINLTLLVIFGTSLFFPPTVIERLARIKSPELSADGIVYTRKVTQIWSVFFIINATIAFYTALYASIDVWTMYNGLIAYLLMGILFFGEIFYRKQILKINT